MPLVKISTGFSELIPVKNIAGVIRAIPKNAELWIIGDGPERNNLEKLSKSLKVKVRFWGRVDNQRAREIMRKSDIFILFSSHEGMPHAVLEALAEKVPVILSDIPAHREIIVDGESGILVELGSVEKLVLAITKLATDNTLGNKLAANAYKVFRTQFTWEKHLDKLLSLFQPITQGRLSPKIRVI